MEDDSRPRWNHYIINGYKRWITGAGDADFAQIVTATDRNKGSRGGLTVFLAEMDTPGIKRIRQQDLMISDKLTPGNSI